MTNSKKNRQDRLTSQTGGYRHLFASAAKMYVGIMPHKETIP